MKFVSTAGRIHSKLCKHSRNNIFEICTACRKSAFEICCNSRINPFVIYQRRRKNTPEICTYSTNSEFEICKTCSKNTHEIFENSRNNAFEIYKKCILSKFALFVVCTVIERSPGCSDGLTPETVSLVSLHAGSPLPQGEFRPVLHNDALSHTSRLGSGTYQSALIGSKTTMLYCELTYIAFVRL
jgi:hypothetical protein